MKQLILVDLNELSANPDLATKRAKHATYMRRYLHQKRMADPEYRQTEREQRREYTKRRLANMTAEQRLLLRKRNAEMAAEYRARHPDRVKAARRRPDVKAKAAAKQRTIRATWTKEQRRAELQRMYAYNLKRHTGLTLEKYNALLEAQGNGCAICSSPNPGGKGRYHIDHNHITGVVRGLLCHGCNTGIGNLKESQTLLRNALLYLEKHQGKTQ